MTTTWPFNELPNAVTITTRHVMERGLPILVVTHDADDGCWQMLCGTIDDPDDARMEVAKCGAIAKPKTTEDQEHSAVLTPYSNSSIVRWTETFICYARTAYSECRPTCACTRRRCAASKSVRF